MKKEIILKNLIETYLNELNPISSGELKRKCDLPFSPSTIRNYFQKLDGEGMLVKVHISSGSIPSKDAIKRYWYDNLNFDNISISYDKLDEVSKRFDVFISVKEKEHLRLENIFNVENKFIILDFNSSEVVLKFSKEIFILFNELKKYSLNDIRKILKSLGIEGLISKFFIQDIRNFNREFLYKHYKEFKIDSLLNDKIFEKFEKGLSFNKDFLAYKIDAKINNLESEFIVLGDIYTNYVSLFNSIKEV